MLNPNKKIGCIAIYCALENEARPIAERLALAPQAESLDPHLTAKIYRGRHAGTDFVLCSSGIDPRYQTENIGTNAAVLCTFLLIDRYQPDLLINAGTAGAFQNRGARIGDVYLGQGDVRFHDRRSPVARYHDYCVGFYPVVPAPQMVQALNLKTGIVSSGNSFDCSPEDRRRLDAIGADLKEMEAAAVGWVAWTKRVPWFPIKVVTDYVEESESVESQFVANWRIACENLGEATERVANFVAGRTLSSL